MEKPFKIIKNRTIEEISKENKELLQKIKDNAIELHTKKLNEKQEKANTKLEKLLKSKRKTFAFHILSLNPINFEKTKTFVETLWKKMGKNISKFIYINNFIYIKSKENTLLSDEAIEIDETCKLVQIHPQNILKLQ